MEKVGTEILRNLKVGDTFTADVTYAEAQCIRTLANRLANFDEYSKKGISIAVHYVKATNKVTISKLKL